MRTSYPVQQTCDVVSSADATACEEGLLGPGWISASFTFYDLAGAAGLEALTDSFLISDATSLPVAKAGSVTHFGGEILTRTGRIS
jgi:hypothetical protein